MRARERERDREAAVTLIDHKKISGKCCLFWGLFDFVFYQMTYSFSVWTSISSVEKSPETASVQPASFSTLSTALSHAGALFTPGWAKTRHWLLTAACFLCRNRLSHAVKWWGFNRLHDRGATPNSSVLLKHSLSRRVVIDPNIQTN